MKLFNTKTQENEQFHTLDDQASLYVVGREPEEEMQISHLFLYSVADVLVRYLEMKGLQVAYGHIVDDASSEDRPPSQEWAEDFARALQSLNIRPPDYFSEATANHPDDIDVLLARAMNDKSPPARFRLRTAKVNQAKATTGGALTAKEMLQRFSGDAIRIYLAQHHYRSPWTHDQLLLDRADQHAEKLKAAIEAMSTGERLINIAPVRRRFQAALDNDLDTVKAIATLLNLADEILFRAPNDYLVEGAQLALRQMATVFGLRLDRELPESRVVTGWHLYQERIRLDPESTTSN